MESLGNNKVESRLHMNRKIHARTVIKRDGREVPVEFDKITQRIKALSGGLAVEPSFVSQEVIANMGDKMHVRALDELAAETAAHMITTHPDYVELAGRLVVSNLHKETPSCFSEAMEAVHGQVYPVPLERKSEPIRGFFDEEFMSVVRKHAKVLDAAIRHDADYTYDYFGINTLLKSYLNQVVNATYPKGKIMERPQYMLMRVAVALNQKSIPDALITYEALSSRKYIHASPTLFNAGKPLPQCSSCFLLTVKEDSIDGIYRTLRDVALISKHAGGIGLSIHNIRAKGSLIKTSGAESDGLVPMLKVFEATARYCDQGGRRKGAFACFCKDTEVVTVNGGVKKIQEVQIGDLVVTHKNKIQPVTQVHTNPLGNRKIYKLVVERNKDIYVTGNHRFWSYCTKQYEKENKSLGWNSVEELKSLMDHPETARQSCYVTIPYGSGIQDTKLLPIDVMDFKTVICGEAHDLSVVDGHKIRETNERSDISPSQAINRMWHMTHDLVNFFGIWLGDGYIKHSKNLVRGIGITVDVHNKPEINFIKKICEETFGVAVREMTSKTSNCVNLTVHSSIVGIIFKHLFGEYVDGKSLPTMVFGWPKEYVESLLAGFITSNGHIAKRKNNATIGLPNHNLANQIYHLCRMNNMASSFVQGRRFGQMTCDSYTVSIPLSKNILNQTRQIYQDDRIQNVIDRLDQKKTPPKPFLKILDIVETERKDDFVYTLGVKDDHSYTVEGLLCENCYIEPWHADIVQFLDLKKNRGIEEERARDLFYGLWVNDLFMERIEADQEWTLMSPDTAPGLCDVYGEEFNKLYTSYEAQGLGMRTIKARDLWKLILDAQTETGTPYILYKDACNQKSNQKNLGTIRSSNLCCEIIEYTSPNEVAVCNLSSIGLPQCVVEGKDGFSYDFNKLYDVTYLATKNLDRVIDYNYYPIPEAEYSNKRHRPVGLGVQGLADVFCMLKMPFTSPEAQRLNKDIFETMYFASLTASKDMAKEKGPYETYAGSPVSQGILQFDMWGVTPDSGRWDWDTLRQEIKTHGVRNSLLMAPMPTASSSQILGNNEACEPFTRNIYVRRTLAGEFVIFNKYLVKDMLALGLWEQKVIDQLVADDGSVQHIEGLPEHLKEVYKGVYELKVKPLIDMAADRGAYIDQSQSFNIFVERPTFQMLNSIHFYGWKKGLKTGMYYLRSKSAVDAIKFTIDPEEEKKGKKRSANKPKIVKAKNVVCTDEICTSCQG